MKNISLIFIRTCISTSLVFSFVACSENPDALLSSAKDYLDKNDPKAALIQVKNLLQTNPDMPEARFLMGEVLLRSGDPFGAEAEFRKSRALQFSEDRVVPELAKSLLAQGQGKKVTDEFSHVQLSQPTANANLQLSLTSAYALQGKVDSSKQSLNAALLADPGYIPARVVLARQQASEGDIAGSLSALDAIIADTPQSFEAWKLKGDILQYEKKLMPDAVLAYKKSVEIKPDFLMGQAALITLLMQQGDADSAAVQLDIIKKFSPGHPQVKFLEGQLAFIKKNYKLSLELAQQVLMRSPTHIQALQLAGISSFQLNALPQAEAYLTQLVKLAPNLPTPRRSLVLTYLKSSQPEKALTALLPLLSVDKPDSALLWLAGEVYLQNSDIKQAESYFSRASKMSPNDVKKRVSLALVHMVDGQTASAFGELVSIAGTDDGISADLALITVHLKRGEYDKALQSIAALEKKQALNPLVFQLRGRTLAAKNDIQGARKSYERALALDPNYFPAISSLASLDLLEKRPADAKKRFQAVLANSPKNAQALLALAEIAIRTGASSQEITKLLGDVIASSPGDVLPRLMLINFHINQQNFKAASSVAQDAVSALPDSADLLDALGQSQQFSGELNQAMATFNKLALLQPLSPQPYMRLAEVHLLSKNKEAVVQNLNKALEIKPDFLPAQRGLINIDIDAKNYPHALAVARTIQTQRPKQAVGYLLEGDIIAVQKNWVGAAAAFTAGLSHVKAPELAVRLHSALLAAGKTPDADKFSADWQRDNPKDAVYLMYLGDLFLARNELTAAENVYASLIKLQPENAIAYNNLAWVGSKLNRLTAVSYAEKANALMPGQPAFMDTLAVLLSSKGDHARAIELQNKALALQPKNSLYRLNLAKIYLKSGKSDLARKELVDLEKLGNKFSAHVEVANLLRSL